MATRYHLTFLILFLLGQLTIAQKVGINTDTPLFDLDVRGLDDVTDGGELQLGTPSESNFLRFFSGRLGDHHPFLAFHEDDTFHFVTTLPDWSTFIRRMTWLPSGLVGINVESPMGHLDIRPTDSGVGAYVHVGNVANTQFLRLYSGSDPFPGPALIWPNGAPLRLGSAENSFTERMRITSAGLVGIGTIAPVNPLDIRRDGTMGSPSIVLGLISDVSNRPVLQFSEWDAAVPGSGMAIEYDGTAENKICFIGTDLQRKFTFTTSGRLGIATDDPIEYLEIGDSGRMFIGNGAGANRKGLLIDAVEPGNYVRLNPFDYSTSSNMDLYLPGDVNIGHIAGATGYKLSVGGKIMAEEVRIQLQGSWPDYVFDPEYNLRSPDNLEKEILRLGHLPGIPSAATFEKEGVELGEMQRLMMEKIEELTLYIIQQQKQIQSMENQVALLIDQN